MLTARAARWLLAALALPLLVSCGVASKEAGAAISAAPAMRREAAQSQPADAPVTEQERAGGQAEDALLAAVPGGAPAPQPRLRVYTATASLSVDSVENAREALVEIAEGAGGYIETLGDSTVVLRVPAADFRRVLEEALRLGRVLERRVETYDVTEEYQDVAGRLDVARKTRDRLYALLEATRKVDERLAILKEIRRLTEQVEALTLSLQTLEQAVAYSRIQIELQSRLAVQTRLVREIPFEWIAALDPLGPSTGRLRAPIGPELGDSFAVLSRRPAFRAESPEGVRVRIGTVPNRPAGDTGFWQEALAWHLGPLYAASERIALGELRGVLLTSDPVDGYTYLVAVAARGDRLHVVEVFYPTPEALTTRGDTVRAALARLVIP